LDVLVALQNMDAAKSLRATKSCERVAEADQIIAARAHHFQSDLTWQFWKRQ
jgi:hypothetical protein